MLKIASLLLLIALAGASLAAAQDAQTPAELCASADTTEPATREFDQPAQVLQPGVDYRAVLCTGAGPVYVDLLEDFAPVTVNSFVFLAQNGFYNNTTFHRVIPEFMVQGGDPTGTGTGGPGYQFQDEFAGFLTFDRAGWLAMANANQPEAGIVGTNGSQFFITTVPTPHLDFRHTIFGEVLEGQENVAAIEVRDPQTATAPGTSLDTVVIVSDAAGVESTYTAPAPATREEVDAAFAEMQAMVPPELALTLISQATDDVTASAPESAREALAALLATNNHAFRSGARVETCEVASAGFMTISYVLDAFATAEDAAAALADPYLEAVLAAEGLTPQSSPEVPNAVYSGETTACDTAATRAVTQWQRGRYLVTAEATIPADSQIPVDAWLGRGVGMSIFEPVVADVLRRELRTE